MATTTAPPRPGDLRRGALRRGALGRRVLGRVREGALTLLAVVGALCLLLSAAGVLGDASLVVFRTGSMSPTMPVGALAVVRAVPAATVGAGDVVTVERAPGALPVTHRVVATSPRPGHPSGAVLTLRGDANDAADPVPYEVDEVRRVLLAVPAVGGWLERVRTPTTMLLTTVLAAAGVAWAFWPRPAGAPGSVPRRPCRHRA